MENKIREIEIIGEFEYIKDSEFDIFFDEFIKSVEKKGWYLGGGYTFNKECIDFSICVVVPFNISLEDVKIIFINHIKKYKYYFYGEFRDYKEGIVSKYEQL